MVKESAGSQEHGKGNSSLLSKDRPEGGWKWKVGIAGLDMLGWTVCVSRARVCDELLCLLCDFIMEPVLHVPQASVSIWSPGYGGDAILLLCFVFSEVQQPTDRTTSPCFWFLAYSKPEHLKVKLKIFTRRKKKTTPPFILIFEEQVTYPVFIYYTTVLITVLFRHSVMSNSLWPHGL